MRSMGLGSIRMIFFPAGWILPSQWGSQGYQPPYFSSDWTEVTSNLPEFLSICAERNIQVDIASPSPYLLTRSRQTGVYDWVWAYGSGGWNNFMADTRKYITDLVNAVENSPYASTVCWYDISNEIYTTPFYYKYPIYLQAIYDGGWVTASKIGFSVLRVPPTGLTDYDNLKNGDSDSPWLGTYRARLTKLTDSHSYPEKNAGDWDVGAMYNKARSLYPNSTTICGEYGISYTAVSEADQRDKEITLMNSFISAGVPYAMHWLWTGMWPPPHPGAWDTSWFRNDDINQPNDIVCAVGTKLSQLTNGDMELGTNGVPTGWGYGIIGGQNVTGARLGPGNAATNSYYFRLTSMMWALPFIRSRRTRRSP